MPHAVRSFPSRAAVAALVVLALAPAPAASDWSPHANLNTPLATGPIEQGGSFCLADGAGGVFVFWTAGNNPEYDLFAQRYDAFANPLWTPGGVPVCTLPNFQLGTTLMSDGAGGIIVTWADLRNGSNFDLYAQRLDGAGAVQWAVNGVLVAGGPGEQGFTSATSDGAGGAIIAWEDTRSSPNEDLYAQRIGPTGAGLWTANGIVIAAATGAQRNPAVVSDDAGGAIIAWQDGRAGENDIYGQRVSPTGVAQWPAGGVIICDASGGQNTPVMAADGAGGAFLAWHDYRGGPNSTIYAHRVDGTGAARWPADGVLVNALVTGGDGQRIIADGTGGCIVAWTDYRQPGSDIYAQRLTASGAPLWTTNGAPVCDASEIQIGVELLADGFGGAIFVWADERHRAGESDLFAQRLDAYGTRLWPYPITPDGVPVSLAAGDQYSPAIADDGRGGVVVTFSDQRTGPAPDVYGQRIERFGALGNPEPRITGVRDVPNDQGGRVRVSWTASHLDHGPLSTSRVHEYHLWRRVPADAALRALAAGARLEVAGEIAAAAPAERRIRRGGAAGAFVYWEYVQEMPANGHPSYSVVTTTTGDSVAGSNPYTTFMIEARHDWTGEHWDSPPDSGYSVDDLAPAAPTPFAGTHSGGTSMLQWGASGAPDFAHYRLYRGTTPDFPPSPASLVAAVTTTAYVHAAGALYWYKVTAVDVHGNEGPAATTLPSGTTDAPPRAATLWLGPASPNPARAEVAFRFGLATPGPVRIAMFDQQGRAVRGLAAGAYGAGEHAVRWDGRDEAGRPVESGLYFYVVEAAGLTRTGRIAVLR